MRVALLNDSFPPVIDGVANVVVNYGTVLQKMGHEPLVAVPDYPDVHDDYPFPVLRYRSLDTTKLFGYRAGYPFSAAAIDALQAFQPEIIHSHCPVASNLLARTVREGLRVPVVFTYHTKFDIDIRTAVRGHLLQNELIAALVRNVQACDEVWTVSRGAGENLRSIGYEGDYIVMENGVDMPRGRAGEAMIQRVDEMCGLQPGVPVFLFAGRLRWYKGIRHIVEGLAKAMRAGADFRMIFVGDGTDRQAIETLCAQAYIMPKCVFIGAVQDRELLRAFYSRADLFLFPSTFDTNGIVVREAAACGLGALLVRGSCAAEGVTDGRNGLLMEENADDLCRKVLFACAHMDEVRRIGEKAQEELYISWDTAVARAQERYRAVIENSRSQPAPHRRDLFPLVSDWVEMVNRTREISQQVIDMLR
ncbi:MAG: glycosyltransferase [Clostridia bacterium]|nr:glycosyltransferase [Clostridia bacterium]